MKLLKNNLAKAGVMVLAVSALGGSVFAATQMQGAAQKEGKVLEASELATPATSTEVKPGDLIGYMMGDEENSEPQAMVMGENGEIVYRALTEEEAKELENATVGVAVEAYTLSEEEAAKMMKEGTLAEATSGAEEAVDTGSDYVSSSFTIDREVGKITEGMSPELVGNGIFGATGINGEEMTAEHMEIKEDGTVTFRALTQEEMKEFGLK